LDSIVARYDIRRADLCWVRPAAAACPAWRGAAAGLLFGGVPSAGVPPAGRAGVGDDRGRTPPPAARGRLSVRSAASVPAVRLAWHSGRVLRRLLVLCL